MRTWLSMWRSCDRILTCISAGECGRSAPSNGEAGTLRSSSGICQERSCRQPKLLQARFTRRPVLHRHKGGGLINWTDTDARGAYCPDLLIQRKKPLRMLRPKSRGCRRNREG